jgi:cytidine deaminase
MNTDDLAAAARAAAEGSYAPYSGFRVGAVVVGDRGEVFIGANVENAAYPASSCAEATAINTAVSHGVRKIETVAVACIDALDVEGAYPCGRCRQIMSEFDVSTVIIAGAPDSEIREHTLDELLPHRFRL